MYSPNLLKAIFNSGYSSSDLISRVFTGCPFPLTREEFIEDEKKTIAKGNLNNFFYGLEKKILIAHIKFYDNFMGSLVNPTEKTKKAADFYPEWFKMCCHLKYLFSELEEEGLKLFKLFSGLSKKYNEKDCKKFWDNCKPKYGSIPGVFSIIDKYQIPETKMPNRRAVVKKSFF